MPVEGERRHGVSRVAASLPAYAARTLRIILATYRDYWPLRFFVTLSMLGLAPGAGLVAFLFWHRWTTGRFTPHIWAGFTGASLAALGLLVLVIGLTADMTKRVRLGVERLLYYERKREYGGCGASGPP
jgi:hypothetical protein